MSAIDALACEECHGRGSTWAPSIYAPDIYEREPCDACRCTGRKLCAFCHEVKAVFVEAGQAYCSGRCWADDHAPAGAAPAPNRAERERAFDADMREGEVLR